MEVEEFQRQAATECENAQVAGEMLDAVKATIGARDLCIDSLLLEVQSAELWATGAEESARQAGAKAAENKSTMKEAGERAATAEKKAAVAGKRTAVAEEATARAVDDFRKSAAFEEELADATTGSYLLGFRDGKEKVGCIYGLIGLEGIEPNNVLEESASPAGPTDGELAPAKREPADSEPALAEARPDLP